MRAALDLCAVKLNHLGTLPALRSVIPALPERAVAEDLSALPVAARSEAAELLAERYRQGADEGTFCALALVLRPSLVYLAGKFSASPSEMIDLLEEAVTNPTESAVRHRVRDLLQGDRRGELRRARIEGAAAKEAQDLGADLAAPPPIGRDLLALWLGLKIITPAERDLLYQRFVLEMMPGEIAEEMSQAAGEDIPVSRIKMRIQYALLKVRRAFEEGRWG
jgi:hypothetical protein